MAKDTVSDLKGQTWIRNVRRCLMRAIVESNFYNSTNTTCDQLKKFAFDSHPKCYVDNGFCTDILISPNFQNIDCLASEVFIWTDFLNKFAIQQLITTSQLCTSTIATQFLTAVRTYITKITNVVTRALIQAIFDFLNCDTAGLDMILVLDSSGSIGSTNFVRLRNFIINMLSIFTIGPDKTRVGVIRYSSSASIVIPLGSSGSYPELSSHISSISYTGGGTYTDEALTLLTSAFATTRIDEGVPRVAIVFTDGVSHSPSLTLAASRAVHNAGIYTYSFGIGSGINSDELNYIATGPDYVFYIDSFSSTDFQTALLPLRTTTCITQTLLSVGRTIEGTVERGLFRLIKFFFPQHLGMTIKINVDIGNVIVRGSFTVPNPTELTQDFVVTSDGSDIDYFVSSQLFESSTTVNNDSQQRRKRQAPNNT
ncbi:PREDICTED: collagen alpha-3(VI) chain-like, partial [Amphimedon queenslandica]|uniref:VWFA domain-containing protein n=2 Tax=Amphimedon queenslandica TaxID=400682 RepID=A0AAN0ITT8_AMPQE